MSCRGRSGPRPTGHGVPPEPARSIWSPTPRIGEKPKKRAARRPPCTHTRRVPRVLLLASVVGFTGGRGRVGLVFLGGELAVRVGIRSEEHTSELQSLMRISYAVFCLKKKTNKTQQA